MKALLRCGMKGQDAERLAGVLAQCPALGHLDLSGNYIFGALSGTQNRAGALGAVPSGGSPRISATIGSAVLDQRGLQNPGVGQKVDCF